MIRLVSLQSPGSDNLKTAIGEYPQGKQFGGVDQDFVMTPADNQLVKSKAQIGVVVWVALPAQIRRRLFVNVHQFAFFIGRHACSTQERGGSLEFGKGLEQLQ